VSLPAGMELTVDHAPGVGAAALARRWLELLGAFRSGPLASWEVGPGTPARGSGTEELLAALAARPRAGSFALDTEAGAWVTVTADPDEERWTAHCHPPTTETDERLVADWLTGALDVVRRLPADEHVATAVLSRQPLAETQFVPAPPLARWNHAIITDDAEVATGYLRPEVFWTAWDGHQRIGGKRLVWRAAGAVREEDWAVTVLADQLELARAARPGLTWWFHPVEVDWNEPLVAPPEHRLEVVGYLPGEQVLELAGWFDEDEHVPLADILTIRALTEAGRTSDDRPLRTVRVIFPEADMAAREAVPLLDVGAEVLYEDREGEHRPVELPG
jgi:hypothetical protein